MNLNAFLMAAENAGVKMTKKQAKQFISNLKDEEIYIVTTNNCIVFDEIRDFSTDEVMICMNGDAVQINIVDHTRQENDFKKSNFGELPETITREELSNLITFNKNLDFMKTIPVYINIIKEKEAAGIETGSLLPITSVGINPEYITISTEDLDSLDLEIEEKEFLIKLLLNEIGYINETKTKYNAKHFKESFFELDKFVHGLYDKISASMK